MSTSDQQSCGFLKCSRSSNRVEPSPSGTVVEDSWSRLNGFQYPWHPQQIFGWIMLLITVIFIHTVLIPSLCKNNWIPLHIFFSLISSVLVCSIILATICDCKDAGTTDVKEDSLSCSWCKITLNSHNTKHCSLCNKCIEGFDHHCKWLNQCIGRKNYRCFIVSISTACLLSLAVFFLCIAEILLLFSKEGKYQIHPHFLNIAMRQSLFTTLTGIFLALSGVAAALLIHLCAFHVFICWYGWTTYEYIKLRLEQESNNEPSNYLVNQRDRKKSKILTQCPCFFCFDLNSITTEAQTRRSSVFTISRKRANSIPHILLHQALSNIVHATPSLQNLTIVPDQAATKNLSVSTHKIFTTKNKNLPKIIRTSPTLISASETRNSPRDFSFSENKLQTPDPRSRRHKHPKNSFC